ncbi:hypothetical protein A2V94_07005 [Candidatus Atribacteria bacterium RBG_16_35_8]|nr:MAG: hypothetical protein A2V94_07005 [Candidatus Atribacteria bacterium RBG_16_35_8]
MIEASIDELQQEAMPEEEPKVNEDKYKDIYPFHFKWTSKRGQVFEGDFVNKILSIKDQMGVGVLRAKLAGNTPIESLDAFTVQLNMMVAHLTISLIEKPEWAKDLRDLKYADLLESLYSEVASHEATFFGY